MPDYTVLVSLDGGRTWARREGTVKATTRTSAAEKVRKGDPNLVGNDKAAFLPLASYEPIRKSKQLVERWAWGPAGKAPAKQEELGDAPE